MIERVTISKMRYLELLGNVEQWAKDRGLDTVEARTQYTKLTEEQGELGLAIDINNIDGDSGVKDSLGDYQVTLIIYCLIRGIDLKGKIEKQGDFWAVNDDLERFEEEHDVELFKVKDEFIYLTYQSSQMIGKYNRNKGVIEEHKHAIRIMQHLYQIAKKYNTTLEGTLEMAYNEIKDRKGKMIDGVFVKEADLNE